MTAAITPFSVDIASTASVLPAEMRSSAAAGVHAGCTLGCTHAETGNCDTLFHDVKLRVGFESSTGWPVWNQ
jgi:hypothetical protein